MDRNEKRHHFNDQYLRDARQHHADDLHSRPEVDPLEVVLGDGPVPELLGADLVLEVPRLRNLLADLSKSILDVIDLWSFVIFNFDYLIEETDITCTPV